MNIFLVWLYFLHFVYPMAFSDGLNRGDVLGSEQGITPHAVRMYTVHPSDPNNPVELSETKTFLQSVADKELQTNREGDRLISWTVSLKEAACTKDLESHPGIQGFELQDTSSNVQQTNARQEEEDPCPRTAGAKPSNNWEGEDPDTWLAWAKDPFNWEEVNKTREWLDSNVKDKTLIFQILRVPDEGESWDNQFILGWYHLILDDAGVEEAKKQPGIAEIEVNHRLIGLKAIPPMNAIALHGIGSAAKKVKRAPLDWKKQDGADEDLILDSKYA
jgi:hypothetical protein